MTQQVEVLKATLAGRYAVERELGRGGMAAVYLASDLKHRRRVAIKVLAPDLATTVGPDRFLQEIELAAGLTHPNILPLHDSGAAGDPRDSAGGRLLYYVMPYVEGESLRDRLRREKQLPLGSALEIARDVASALEHAHRHGVVHRDIKPENILLAGSRAVVADFGIARAVGAAGGERLTGTGLTVGTPAYMSPEQATGEGELDGRTDIYSLGCVLYEMLAGEPPYTGSTPQAVIAKRLGAPVPRISTLREMVPEAIERAITRALAKAPADRFATAGEFAQTLGEAGVSSGTAVPRRTAEAGSRGRRGLRAAAGVGGWALLAVGMLVGGWAWQRSRLTQTGESAAVRRWDIVLPDSAPLAFVGDASLALGRASLAISPDGSRMVYVAQRGATTQLYLRELDRLDATALPGTAGAYQPFFSPDGEWIGFFAGRELKKISLRGTQPVTLAVTSDALGAAWGPDGRILLADREGRQLGWVHSGGGAPQPIERHMRVRVWHPQLVAEGQWVLHGSSDGVLYLHSLATGWPYAITSSGVVRRDSADVDELLYGTNPRYLESGHIAYFSGDGALMAIPFDMTRRRVLGAPVPVLEGVRLEAQTGGPQLGVSRGGTLVYAPGESARLGLFAWVDHATKRVDTLPLAKAAYGAFDLSPDGRHILVRVGSAAGPPELWVLDIGGGSRARLPTQGIVMQPLRWWPDGVRVMYRQLSPAGVISHDTPLALRQSLRNPEERDTLPAGALEPHPDGRHVVQFDRGAMWLSPVEKSGGAVQLTLSAGSSFPAISPDGGWLAYTDREDQPWEVYVSRVGQPAERTKISAAGGEEPVWTPDGRTVIYRDRQEWFAVDVSTTDGFRAGRPRLLFRGPFLQVPGVSHDVSSDGRRQLVLVGPPAAMTNHLIVVTNWYAEVERLAPRRR